MIPPPVVDLRGEVLRRTRSTLCRLFGQGSHLKCARRRFDCVPPGALLGIDRCIALVNALRGDLVYRGNPGTRQLMVRLRLNGRRSAFAHGQPACLVCGSGVAGAGALVHPSPASYLHFVAAIVAALAISDCLPFSSRTSLLVSQLGPTSLLALATVFARMGACFGAEFHSRVGHFVNGSILQRDTDCGGWLK